MIDQVKLKDIGEMGLIERLTRKVRLDKSVVNGIGDDTAVIKWIKDKYLLFTCDMLVEDVHFSLKDAAPFAIGRKALGRNISDIAAMGGVPRYALVAVGIDPSLPLSFTDGIYRGISSLARDFDINIVGGDTARSRKLVIDISMIGQVEKENLVLRSGAKAGDLIMVTGAIGGSGKGRHLDFTPRIDVARRLVKNFKVNSMIDISDGFALDLRRILDASKVGAIVYENAVPISKEAVSFDSAIQEGEDFELLFTMGIDEARRFFKTALRQMKTPVTLVGEIVERRGGFKLIRQDGKEASIKVKGYLHF